MRRLMRSDTDCKVLPHPCNRDEAECRRSAPARPLPHTANHKPRAREESMPDLGEFAALFVVLFLTMYW